MMGEWTQIEGAMRVRSCPAADALIAKLVEIVGEEFVAVDVADPTPDGQIYIDVGLDMATQRGIGTACKIEECLQEFEPYLKEPAQFETNVEDMRGEFWIGDRRGVICKLVKRWQLRRKRATREIQMLLNELDEIEAAERKVAEDG